MDYKMKVSFLCKTNPFCSMSLPNWFGIQTKRKNKIHSIGIVFLFFFQCLEYVAPKMDANDRAEKRRQAVGSSCEHEKTKAASLNAYVWNSIEEKNVKNDDFEWKQQHNN